MQVAHRVTFFRALKKNVKSGNFAERVDLLIGDLTKSKTQLGWVPKYDLTALVKEMVASDLKLF
jgi:GDP-D-mannose dehydratase